MEKRVDALFSIRCGGRLPQPYRSSEEVLQRPCPGARYHDGGGAGRVIGRAARRRGSAKEANELFILKTNKLFLISAIEFSEISGNCAQDLARFAILARFLQILINHCIF